MPSCSVKWCSNHTSTCSLKSKNGVSFHRFPKDEATCQKWVEAVRHERRDPWWTSSNASRICSIHFKETDISSTPCKVNILAKTAVPVCTMVWHDENIINTTLKTFNVRTNTDKPILKTYERKKTNMNVLKELKVNMSYSRNKEGTAMSQTNSVVISNTTPCLSQENSPQATKLLKTLEVSKTLNFKDGQESNSIANISSKTSANANVTEAQKIKILTESNTKEYIKSCKEKCCKSKILVKLNENTSLIVDEDWSNDDTIFKDSNKVSKEPNSRTIVNSRNVILKEFKSNENKEPNEVTNISNADKFVKTITDGNVVLNANISKSYVGKMLRTYLPKRKDTTSGKNIRDTSKLVKKNKSAWSITTKKGLNTIKCKEVKNTNVNKHPKGDFRNKLKIRVCYKNNIIADQQSKTNPQEKKQYTLLNVKKNTFKKTSNLFNRPRIREKKTVGVDLNIDANKESNIAHIDKFITDQSRIDNIREKDTTVYDEIISELFETSKSVGNVSNLPSNDNYQVSNKNVCTDHNKDKGTNTRNVILDLDTNIYTELNTLMDLELCRVENTGLHGENIEINTDKTAFNESFTQFKQNTMSESDQPIVINNKNMYSNENINNNAILLPRNELQNLETTVVRNIFPETKKEKFTELKKYLSMKPKLDIDKNISSTSLTKENLQVSNRDHNSEFNKNIDIDVNDMVTSLQSNINIDTTKEIETNVTSSQQLSPILFEEFINNIALESNKSENMDFITNFNTDPNTTRYPEFNKKNISDIKLEGKKNIEKDMPDLDTFMNLESFTVVNLGLNEMNTDKTGTNADLRDYNENTATESNQNLSMEHGDRLITIAIESDYHLRTEMNGYNTTQFNKNMCYNGNITNNATLLSNNELQKSETSVSNIVTETKEDNFNELKKHLFTKPNLDITELCTNTQIDTSLSDSTMPTAIINEDIQVPDRGYNAQFDKNTNINVNDMVTSSQNHMNTDINKETESILLEELITNTIPVLNNSENLNFNNNLKTDRNTTRPYLNEKEISDIIECKKGLEKDMPELNTVILSELNDDQVIKSKEVMNIKFNHLNSDMYDKELLLQKSKKDLVNVLATSDDQYIVVNEHMDVVDSILNRDIAAEFDLSLLLSDTPIPDEEIRNLDNNSYNNSLDDIVGSPNWIQLPTGEMPKIIDDILDQGSPFFENLDLFDKANKFNIDKEANKKDNENKKLIKQKYSTSNLEQLKEQIINNYCENGKQCTKNSIARIEKQVIAEISDYNETSPKQRNNICSENKDSQSEKVTAEKYYDLYDEQTNKQIHEQYIQSNNEQCEKIYVDQIVDKRYENRNKEIQVGNNTINQCQQNNVDFKANQIEEPTSNQYFEQSEKLPREPDGLDDIDNSNDIDTFEPSKKQSDKQSNEQNNQSCVGKHITMEESIPKSKIHSQGNAESNDQEINSKLFKDCNEKIIEVNNVSNVAHTVGTESVHELNVGQLKRAIFEECYDPECGNNCKNQIHNSNTESHKKNDEQYKNQTNYTRCQPAIEKRKGRYDLFYKRQCYQTSTDNLNKQLNNSSFDPNTKEMKKKSFLDRHKLSHNEKPKTKCKKIAIDHIPGQYLELRWKESEGKSNSLSQEGCKRKHKELGLDQRKMMCSQSTNIFSQQIMAECPECGYTTDDNDLMNYKSDVDLTITKPLSLINKDMLISLHDIENENNENNNRVTLESVYAMELAYVTAIQALERKLKQKIAISEYRLRRVNNLSQINNQLTNVNITLMDLFHRNN